MVPKEFQIQEPKNLGMPFNLAELKASFEEPQKELSEFKHCRVAKDSFIYNGNNIEIMSAVPDNFADSFIIDGPYGINYMKQEWDQNVPSVEFWEEAYRILKPGGYILSFGATKTYHKMVANVELAGFEIKDLVAWCYGQGSGLSSRNISNLMISEGIIEKDSDEANYWSKFKTKLKPAIEPILMAMKPIAEPTIAKNVLQWGTGCINVEDCLIPISDHKNFENNSRGNERTTMKEGSKLSLHSGGFKVNKNKKKIPNGRMPSNLLLDEQAQKILNQQFAALNSERDYHIQLLPSRYFYCSKPSITEKEFGLDDFEAKVINPNIGNRRDFNSRCGNCEKKFVGAPESICKCENPVTNNDVYKRKNHHSTVKPIDLLEYLIKLVTPEGGMIFDGYFGSGSLGAAVHRLDQGYRYFGIEINPEYYEIAVARCKAEYEKARNVKIDGISNKQHFSTTPLK